MINIRAAKNPITISQPDGRQLKSTHECNLDIPTLPKKARAAYIVSGLAHTLLVSIKMLVDEGCNVEYDGIYVKVFHKQKIVWQGTREQTTGLWTLPLNKHHIQQVPEQTVPIALHMAHNAYHMTSKQELIQYLHQCLFCPPKATLIKAIENNQLATWSGLKAEAVIKYLPDSCTATDKGYMKRQQKGIRSMQVALEMIEYQECMNPPKEKEK